MTTEPETPTAMAEAARSLRLAAIDYRDAVDRLKIQRGRMHELIVYALRIGVPFTRVAEHTPYTERYVRQIARDAGIEPEGIDRG